MTTTRLLWIVFALLLVAFASDKKKPPTIPPKPPVIAPDEPPTDEPIDRPEGEPDRVDVQNPTISDDVLSVLPGGEDCNRPLRRGVLRRLFGR